VRWTYLWKPSLLVLTQVAMDWWVASIIKWSPWEICCSSPNHLALLSTNQWFIGCKWRPRRSSRSEASTVVPFSLAMVGASGSTLTSSCPSKSAASTWNNSFILRVKWKASLKHNMN
jgi:hypothetical protein